MSSVYLNMYNVAPDGAVSLDNLETVADNRIKLLKIMDTFSMKSFKSQEKKLKYINKKLLKENLGNYHLLLNSGDANSESTNIEPAIKEDHISHFILRIAFCRTRESRKWFLIKEWEWFKLRFQKITDKLQFLHDNNITLNTLDENEKLAMKDALLTIDCHSINEDLTDVVIFKTKFQEVLPLVRSRKCILRNGYAYFTDNLLINFLKMFYLNKLNEDLVNMSLLEVDDDRINDLIAKQKVEAIVKKYSRNKIDFITVEDDQFSYKILDEYSDVHYPLCMKFIHELLKEKHHLRYFARMQYGLFIKELGIPYKEAIEFWEHEFTKQFSKKQFKSKYEYLFKHQYGMVGNVTNQRGYDCESIINSNIIPLDQHGCPFRHWDPDKFENKLLALGVSQGNIKEISDLVNKKKYGEACAKYFEITHGKKSLTSVRHPNEYFQASKEASEQKGELDFLPDIEDIFL